MNNEAMTPGKKHFLLPLILITQEQDTRQDAISNLFIFLIQYSFLFNEPTSEDKILKRDFPNIGELSSTNSNGARYLDPKYSRWLSVDPALGEYVPAAGKGNVKDAGDLPGMGGIYNSVNGSLYHYAGNNPVKYTDPDGESIFLVRKLIVWGINFVILGYGFQRYTAQRGNEIYKNIAKGNYVECSSMELYCLYKSGQGKSVSLTQIGLLDTIKKAVQSGKNNTKTGEPIQKRFIDQLKSGNGTYFERSYEFEHEKFAIGEATITGKFEGSITKNGNGTTHIKGKITYSFSDTFTDPYDTFNITKDSEWNPDGKPYLITDSWTVNINGDY